MRNILARNVIGSLLLKAAYILLTFGTAVLLSRVLGAKGYGIYSYVFALISLLSIPAEFGLPNLVVRETAKALANQKWGEIQGIWRWAGEFILVLTIVLVGAAITGVYFWGAQFSPEHVHAFYWGLALLPLVALGNLRGAALRGLNRVVQGQLPEQVLLPGFFILLILGTMIVFSGVTLTPTFAMSLQVLSATLAFVSGAWFLWRATPMEVRRAEPVSKSRHWLASTLPLAFISGITVIITRTSIIVLGLFVEPANVGIYRIADQMSLLVSVSQPVMNMVIAPQFARLYAINDKVRLQRLTTTSARVMLALTIPVVVVFLLFGKPLLKSVFGAEFEPAYAPLSILTLGQLVNSAMGSVGLLLNMIGKEQDIVRGLAVAAFAGVGNIVLSFILIPLWGINGAALAPTIAIIVWNLILWEMVRRRLGINSMAFDLFGNRKTQ